MRCADLFSVCTTNNIKWQNNRRYASTSSYRSQWKVELKNLDPIITYIPMFTIDKDELRNSISKPHWKAEVYVQIGFYTKHWSSVSYATPSTQCNKSSTNFCLKTNSFLENLSNVQTFKKGNYRNFRNFRNFLFLEIWTQLNFSWFLKIRQV